jgi:hypothetical protein
MDWNPANEFRPMSRILAGAFAASLLLAGCAGPPPPPLIFEALHYEYLTKLRLDVARIDIDAGWFPHDGARHVEALSPVVPVQALATMAQERLLPAGNAGHALFVIDDASIVQERGAYRGRFAVHLEMAADDQRSLGTAAAQVTGVHPITGSDPASVRVDLHDFTRTLMNAMNVELEFQLQHVVREQMQTTPSSPAPEPVQSQPLDAPMEPPA